MSRIIPNQRGIDELLNDAAVQSDLVRRMERSEQEAKTMAPVATGAYRDSIHIEEEAVNGVREVRLIADVRYAIFVEADTGNLSRSLDAAGGS